MTNDYLLLDVFTDRPFGGNQLAVFPAADHLDTSAMQRIARELNLSESVFVMRGTNTADARLRIFTPGMELPFAGHPTIGAAIALASDGGAFSDRRGIVFAETAGDVPVAIERQGGLVMATLTVPKRPVAIDTDVTREAAAALVGLAVDDLASANPTAYSAGVPFQFIAVASVAALNRVALDHQVWRASIGGTEAPHVVALAAAPNARDIHMRMFAPLMGITEDPATGAAAAALAGWLLDHERPGDGTHRWQVHQGHAMGRPSLILLEADVARGRIEAVRVGGSAVIIGRGSLSVG